MDFLSRALDDVGAYEMRENVMWDDTLRGVTSGDQRERDTKKSTIPSRLSTYSVVT